MLAHLSLSVSQFKRIEGLNSLVSEVSRKIRRKIMLAAELDFALKAILSF